MSQTVSRTIAEDGSSTLSLDESSLINTTMTIALSPLALLGGAPLVGQQKFVSEQMVGLAVLGALGGGIALGDRFGDSIPLLGGRR